MKDSSVLRFFVNDFILFNNEKIIVFLHSFRFRILFVHYG